MHRQKGAINRDMGNINMDINLAERMEIALCQHLCIFLTNLNSLNMLGTVTHMRTLKMGVYNLILNCKVIVK